MSEFVIILRKASENYRYVSFYKIVESPRVRPFPVLQFKESAAEYRLFHSSSSLYSSHLDLHSMGKAGTLAGILMTPAVVVALLEIAEHRGIVYNTINVFGGFEHYGGASRFSNEDVALEYTLRIASINHARLCLVRQSYSTINADRL